MKFVGVNVVGIIFGNADGASNVANISDVKIFYLFSNMMMDLKCGPQYDLLANTINLICAVRNKTSGISDVC